MVALQEHVPAPAEVPVVPRPAVVSRRHRAVAVAVDAMELLRPESDLARLLRGFPEVDLLLVAEDVPEDGRDDVRSDAEALGLADLRLHRLGLASPMGAGAEDDVVAAMSELVGFDPEPGVCCLTSSPAPGDPARSAVERAAQRIARVYGLPLMRYRCLELTVV